MSDEDEGARLRRQLRAMAAVNEALRAQLEALGARPGASAPGAGPVDPFTPPPPPLGGAPRRGRVAIEWTEGLRPAAAAAGEAPSLVQREDGALYVLEGGIRRPVTARLLIGPLEDLLGGRRAIDATALEGIDEGAPVEVLEVPGRPPFVVVGGRALTVRGLPMTFPVAPEVLDALAAGPTLDLVAPVAAKRADLAVGWLAAAAEAAPTDPELVVDGDGQAHVIDGDRRRSVGAWLVPALEARWGERRVVEATELATWAEGPPVALLEARRGAPFVVLGGRRLAVRGLPLPHPVDLPNSERLPEGPELDVWEPTATRREGDGRGWLASLADADPARPPRLVTDGATGVSLLDAGRRRRVRSRLLVDALELVFGAREQVTPEELEACEAGPPVEVLESAAGPPFVVIGAKRLPITGLPLPVPVDARGADKLAEGPTLDVVEPMREALRREAARDAEPADPVRELRTYADEKGGLPSALAALTKRGARKITGHGGGSGAQPK